jgi:hypothetical protein
MPDDAATGFEIIVWRPYEPPHQIAFADAGSRSLVYLAEQAQRDVYRWRTREDVWAGLRDDEIRQRLREQITAGFDPFIDPALRGIAKLGEFISILRQAITSGNTTWSVSTQALNDREGPVLINATMTLHNQLRWIYRVFQDVPGASVTVR